MTMSIEMNKGRFDLPVAPDMLDFKVDSDEAPSCNIEESKIFAALCLKQAAVIEFRVDEQYFPALAGERAERDEPPFCEKIV